MGKNRFFDLEGHIPVYNVRGLFICKLYKEMIQMYAERAYELTQQEDVCKDLRSNNIPLEINLKTIGELVGELGEWLERQMLTIVDMKALEEAFLRILFTANLIDMQLTNIEEMSDELQWDSDRLADFEERIELLATAVDLYLDNLNRAIVRSNKAYRKRMYGIED